MKLSLLALLFSSLAFAQVALPPGPAAGSPVIPVLSNNATQPLVGALCSSYNTQTYNYQTGSTLACLNGTIQQVSGIPSQVPNRTLLLTQGLLGVKPPISGIAPTITNNASTTISNEVTYTPSNGSQVIDTTHFSYFGGSVAQYGPSFPRQFSVVNIAATSSLGTGAIAAEAIVNDSQFELIHYDVSQNIRVWIDGAKVLDVGPNTITGTAQAGGASTITLAASGSSATDGAYNVQYVILTGGTGSGQVKQIASYVGATKVATVASAWSTAPDGTTTYAINPLPALFAVANDGARHYALFTFGGVRAPRRVRVETNGPFGGFNVSSSGTVTAAAQQLATRLFALGDSFTAATGADTAFDGFAFVLAESLGVELWDDGSGGTGIVNSNVAQSKLNFMQRALPAVNSWIISNWAVTVQGTFTLTQGAITTASLATNASVATLQAALDTAFGAGNWYAAGSSYYGYVIEGLGANATNTAPLTATPSGQTGVFTTQQYFGDIAPFVPKDSAGTALPFLILVPGSGNDDGLSGLQTAASALYSGLVAKFPTASIVATGRWMSSGPASGAALTTDIALQAAAASLPLVNGQSPFLDLFNNSTGVGYLNGATNIGAPSGVSGVNTDAYVYYDGIHPSTLGHAFLANQILQRLIPILLPL